MQSLFKKIIVPVDFTSNTEIAVAKSIELICSTGGTIYLLHVIKPKGILTTRFINQPFIYGGKKGNYCKQVLRKLQEWKQAMQETIASSNVEAFTMEGSVQDCIVDFSKQVNPDLILIGKKSSASLIKFSSSVYPNRIARLTKLPVLTVSSGSYHPKIKTIVVPVSSFIPTRKIELVDAFAENPRTTIDLVARMGDQHDVLLETYRILKSRLKNPIEYHFLKRDSFPLAAFKHAQSVGADMLFVNPYTESRISVITGKHINDMVKASSKLKILSVEPYHRELKSWATV
jgi:nucleotide-binding universal stress UspA family protein